MLVRFQELRRLLGKSLNSYRADGNVLDIYSKMLSKVIISGLYSKKYINISKRYARPGCNSERNGYNVNVAPQEVQRVAVPFD